MKQGNERFDLTQADRLTEFVDRVLEGKMKQTESNVDDELLGLEKTILRLNQSLPPVSLDEAAVKQMHVRLNTRIRREAAEVKQSFWKRWFSSQSRPQLGITFAAVVLLIVLVLMSPLVLVNSSSAGAALISMGNVVVIAALVGGIVLILWMMRRK